MSPSHNYTSLTIIIVMVNPILSYGNTTWARWLILTLILPSTHQLNHIKDNKIKYHLVQLSMISQTYLLFLKINMFWSGFIGMPIAYCLIKFIRTFPKLYYNCENITQWCSLISKCKYVIIFPIGIWFISNKVLKPWTVDLTTWCCLGFN